jgi:DNA-binding transcriptional regulator YbjK
MTPSRARGRPRSEERRDAVLTAAMELMQEDAVPRAARMNTPAALFTVKSTAL